MNESDDFVEDDFQPDTTEPNAVAATTANTKAAAPQQDDFVEDDFAEDKPERTPLEKTGRLLAQYGLGRLEGTAPGMVYDLAVAPLSNKDAQKVQYKQTLFDNIEALQQAKELGGFPGRKEPWNKEDENTLKDMESQAKDISKSEENVITSPDLSIRGLASMATGVDLHPEGVAEKIASWTGFVNDPKKVAKLVESGVKPKELFKALVPYPNEVFRGIGAGTALQMAEDGKFGPIGTLGAAIVGDIVGHGPKAIWKAVTNPRQTAARVINAVTMNNSRKIAASQLAEDFAKSGIQIDAGTLTGSPLVQMMQAKLTQSGLTGTALDNFRKELSGNIIKEYENILGDLGEITFENEFQASEAIKRALKVNEVNLNAVPKESLNKQGEGSAPLTGRVAAQEPQNYQQTLLNRISPQETTNSYQGGQDLKTAAEDIRTPVKEQFNERWTELNERIAQLEANPQAQLATELERFVNEHQGSLLLGESTPEARVLQSATRLLNRLRTADGALIGVTVEDLIKTKRTLGDVANWEMAGSDFESAYKKIVGDINAAIDRELASNPELRNEFLHLNADYEAYKGVFENKNVQKLFEPQNFNYNSIYKDYVNSPDKLRALEDVFHVSERGEQLVNQVKRDYSQKIIEKPDLTSRDIRDLQNVLGPQFDHDILEFIAERQRQLEQPLPRAIQGERLGLNVQKPQTKPSVNVVGRKISETGTDASKAGVRKKMSEALKGKDSRQIMQQMDTIEGIRDLKRALETTSEGKQLFKELARFKLAEIIDKKMVDAVSQQVKLGQFSNLLNTKKSKDIVRELLSPEAFKRLELLQKNSGKLAQSSGKFYNTSQSGTTLTDMGLIGAATTGVLLGNPYLAAPAIVKIGGSYLIANLLADAKFLKELEKAMTAKYPKQFNKAMERMKPYVQEAMNQVQKMNEKKEEKLN